MFSLLLSYVHINIILYVVVVQKKKKNSNYFTDIALLGLPRAEAITDSQIPCINNGECLRKCPSKSGFFCDPEKGLDCRPKGDCICV